MKIKELRTKSDIDKNKRLVNLYNQFGELLTQLKEKELSDELIMLVNNEIDKINTLLDSEEKLQEQVRNSQIVILQTIKKKLKLVPKNHYRMMWTSIGLVGLGIPLLLLFIILINMGFLKDITFLRVSLGDIILSGIPLSVGLRVGRQIGSIKDKKAFKEGRQLEFKIKH